MRRAASSTAVRTASWRGLRVGRSVCLVRSIASEEASEEASTARVSAGSMTSSTRPRSAA
ncbi:hypothetical protein A6A07_40935 [Streptomyces sp. CB03911]|nr:hypothetical protein A6A07_40935 [Streptomyces sp. CB03911]